MRLTQLEKYKYELKGRRKKLEEDKANPNLLGRRQAKGAAEHGEGNAKTDSRDAAVTMHCYEFCTWKLLTVRSDLWNCAVRRTLICLIVKI